VGQQGGGGELLLLPPLKQKNETWNMLHCFNMNNNFSSQKEQDRDRIRSRFKKRSWSPYPKLQLWLRLEDQKLNKLGDRKRNRLVYTWNIMFQSWNSSVSLLRFQKY
jgi:hypothetical protein